MIVEEKDLKILLTSYQDASMPALPCDVDLAVAFISAFFKKYKTILYVAPSVDLALQAEKVSKFFLPSEVECICIQAPDLEIYSKSTTSSQKESIFLQNLFTMLNSSRKLFIITDSETFSQRTVPIETFKQSIFKIEAHRSPSLSSILEYLGSFGYRRVSCVYEVGEFSVRGGILDVYSATQKYPARIDYGGNKIDTIKNFDPITQVSNSVIQEYTLSSFSEVIITQESQQSFMQNFQTFFPDGNIAKDILYNSMKDNLACPGIRWYMPLLYNGKESTLLDYFKEVKAEPHEASVFLSKNVLGIVSDNFSKKEKRHAEVTKESNETAENDSVINTTFKATKDEETTYHYPHPRHICLDLKSLLNNLQRTPNVFLI